MRLSKDFLRVRVSGRRTYVRLRAFSLIELMVVISLISIAITCTRVNISFLGHSYVRLEIEKLRALCQYAQQKALMTHTEQSIALHMSSTAHGYSWDNIHEHLSQGVMFGVPAGIKGPPAMPMHAIDGACTFRQSRIVFYPDGIISAGTLYMTDGYKKSVYALSSGVGAVSFLRLYRYDKGWQLVDQP